MSTTATLPGAATATTPASHSHALASAMGTAAATPGGLALGSLVFSRRLRGRLGFLVLGLGRARSVWAGELESRGGTFLLGELSRLFGVGKGQRVPPLMAAPGAAATTATATAATGVVLAALPRGGLKVEPGSGSTRGRGRRRANAHIGKRRLVAAM